MTSLARSHPHQQPLCHPALSPSCQYASRIRDFPLEAYWQQPLSELTPSVRKQRALPLCNTKSFSVGSALCCTKLERARVYHPSYPSDDRVLPHHLDGQCPAQPPLSLLAAQSMPTRFWQSIGNRSRYSSGRPCLALNTRIDRKQLFTLASPRMSSRGSSLNPMAIGASSRASTWGHQYEPGQSLLVQAVDLWSP